MRWSWAWAPWLKEELDKSCLTSVFETFPDSVMARKKYWIPFLKDNLEANSSTILVGHSSGAVAAMKFAEENKLLGSLLVSPCYTDLGVELEKQSGYFDEPWQWDKIRSNQKFIALFYSKDDPFIPQGEFAYIKNKLQPECFEFENRGHFSQNTFPEVLNYLKNKLNIK